MQGIVGDVAQADVGPHFGFRPVRERVEFDEAVGFVPFARRQAVAGGRLRGAQAGDPRLFARQRAFERREFAHPAAGAAQCRRLEESVDAVRGNERFHRARVGEIEFEARFVAHLQPGEQAVSFGGQAPGVEQEDFERQMGREHEVGERHIFRTQTVGENERVTEFGQGLRKQRARVGGLADDGHAQGVGQFGMDGGVTRSVHACKRARCTRRHNGRGSSTAPW